MEKIDRELLIKEISSRLPYGIKTQVLGWDEEKGEVEVPLRIYSINTDGYVYFEDNNYDADYVDAEDCLLYLRPMSSMTEEEIRIEREIQQDCFFGRKPLIILTDFYYSRNLDVNVLIEKGLALPAPDGMYDFK